MGGYFSSFFSRLLSRQKEVRILILGLDNAGKTTILYRLHSGQVVETIPTIGFNVETVRHRNIEFQVWDLGGQTSIRPYWRCYFPNTNAIVYVVDSSDPDRLNDARQELLLVLQEEDLKGVALAVLANKRDVPHSLTEGEVSSALGLPALRDRPWSIWRTSALKGEGLQEAMDWLADVLEES